MICFVSFFFFFFQAEDGIRDYKVTGVQTCALPISFVAELEDVVIDRRRRHERPEAVAPRDQVLALEQLQRLPEGHERDAEARREPALGVEPRPGTERALADPRTQRLGDLVVPRQATVDPRSE